MGKGMTREEEKSEGDERRESRDTHINPLSAELTVRSVCESKRPPRGGKSTTAGSLASQSPANREHRKAEHTELPDTGAS